MTSKANNLFIIAPLSVNENHFLLGNGLIDENEISRFIKKIAHVGFLVVVTRCNELNWFDHFWNNKIEDNKVKSFYNPDDCKTIFKHLLNIDETILNLFKFNFALLLKDIQQIESFISDISTKADIILKNFEKYDPFIDIVKSDWQIINLPFLNDLFYKKYPRVCYLVLNDEQKESEYYIVNQTFRSQQDLLIVELENKDSKLSKYRIRLIRQIQKHSYSFFAENSLEILFDFYIYLFDHFGNWEKRFDELFMIHTEDYTLLSKVLDSVDERFCYRWIDEDYFNNEINNKDFDFVENSLWSQKNIFGLIFRKHDYLQRSSDFGSDNSLILVFGDSKYPLLSKVKTLEDYYYPRGSSSENINVYNHFYQNKKLVLVNFDNIPYINSRYYEGCIVDSIEKLSAIKVIRIPLFLIEDTFVLTTDWFK